MRKSEAKELINQAYAAWDAEEWQRAADLYEQVLAHFQDEKPGAQHVFVAAPEGEARRLLDQWAGEKAIVRSWSGLEAMG